MKLRNRDILQCYDKCNTLINMSPSSLNISAYIEFIIFRNYQTLYRCKQIYENDLLHLTQQFGSLGTDGQFHIDNLSEECMQRYDNALESLKDTLVRIHLDKIPRRLLEFIDSLGFETILDLEFMIE